MMMKKTPTETKIIKNNKNIILISSVIGVSIILILATIITACCYVNNYTTANQVKIAKESGTQINNMQDKSALTVKTGKLPENCQKNALNFMKHLMVDVSKKFPVDLFKKSNPTVQALLKGDSSMVPESIKNKLTFGSNRLNMKVSREVIESVSYLGLMIFANAYNKTNQSKLNMVGESLVSYDAKTNKVYMPIQAVVSSDKNIMLELQWTGKTWKLNGEILGWQTYVMLQNQAAHDRLEAKKAEQQQKK